MWIDDDILKQAHLPYAQATWEPGDVSVVLGSSNDPELECDLAACAVDGVPVLRRYGGGGTVVLHPGCVVVSIGTWVAHFYRNDVYFRLLNQAVIDCLAGAWPQLSSLGQRGLSDICFGEQKVAGTSLFRSRNYLLYQASILVAPDLALIEKYLRHPSKEPDYRRGRGHADFVTGLTAVCAAPVADVLQQLQLLADFVVPALGKETVAPVAEQIQHLLRRAGAVGTD